MLDVASQLVRRSADSGWTISKVMLDLTVYLQGPSEHELEYLVDLYARFCPTARQEVYTIAELEYWPTIVNPHLTASSRIAATAGVNRPFLEPVRQRIREGRAFEIQFWDGREIGDPDGSWSFSCRRIHLRSAGLHAFVRILVPLNTDPQVLREFATTVADNVELYSGHGGIVFVYDPWHKVEAMDGIYAQARRFWGIDVEDLNATLPFMKEGIKDVNWITLVGHKFASEGGVEQDLGPLATEQNVTIEQRQHASVLIAGSEPVVGDQHRPDQSLDPYYAVAGALRPLFLTHHPDFSGERFIENGNTLGWIRRFLEPAGWR